MLGAGLPTRGYSLRPFIDLAYAYMAEDWPGYAGRAKLDQALLAAAPDRDSWGTDPAAQAAQRAMMAAGAPRRAGPKPQPEVPPSP